MARPIDRRAVIAGGGIAGLASAVALHKIGWDVELIERSGSFTPRGAGIGLRPNAVRAFRKLGVGERLRVEGFVHHTFVLRTASGSPMSQTSIDWSNDYVYMLRSQLLTMLVDAALGVRMRMSTTVQAVAEVDGFLRVRLSDGSHLECSLVVGADGYRSDLRSQLLPRSTTVFTGQNYWRVTVDADLPDDWAMQAAPGRHLSAIRVGKNLTYAAAHVASKNPLPPGPDRDVEAVFADFGPPLASLLPALGRSDTHFDSVYEAAQDSWYSGRVAFVGDAAHALPPVASQGAGMAAEDAIVLAEELDRQRTVSDALAAYESRRKPRLQIVRQLAHSGVDHLRNDPYVDSGATGLGRQLRAEDLTLAAEP